MNLIKYDERKLKETMVFDLFRSVFSWIKDSRWRKKCKSLIKRARIQLLVQKRRRESIIRQSRADIAQLLKYGMPEDALARVEQLHNDQCVLSAYNQIEGFCDCIYANLRGLGRQSELCDEVNKAVSSLVFAASRCGELKELHRMRDLFKRRTGSTFDRVNVELQPGNFVNSQLMYNLGNNLVPDDVKLQLTSEIATEYTLSLEPQTFSEEICEPRKKDESLDLGAQVEASKIKGMLGRIGLKFSTSNSRNLETLHDDSCDGSSNSPTMDGSPPIKEKTIIYLDDLEYRSWETNVNSNSFVKKNLSMGYARDSLIKKDGIKEKCDGYLHEKRGNYQNMLAKQGLSMRSYCNEKGIGTGTFHHDEIEEDEVDSKPRLSYVHPKLPDYDELVATFTEYKRKSI